LLAEKIETPEQFKRCHELGCDLFQGYFLSKPEIIKGKKIAAGKMTIINLISEIQAPEIDMDGLTSIISRDPALSFKLLKLINSAAFKRSNTIDSIHKAVTLLGIDKIKSWASLLALSKLDDKPEALHYMALVRALMCERLSEYIEPSLKDQFYTVGLLSCLDAFFDQSLSDIVSHISLAPGINDALTLLKGNAGLALSTTIAFEQSEWQKLDWTALAKFELNAKQINEIYFESSRRALEISAEN
ncbi:EAL and HDOD domain-containing protein, partial [Oleiphilus sp. HI0128]